ncbi:conjugal transfer protein TraF [Parasalinivibrio latis]|uniref:conjugal transfer protein TraF n=1 Tax=Parasalinivibrio latis TaxID=2952610 RepID=UPI0030E11987
MKKTLLAASVTLAAFTASASDYNPGARIYSMGGAGSAAAGYLNAGFYNPALAAVEPDSYLGLVIPTFSIDVRDEGDLLDGIDNFQSAFEALESDITDTAKRENAAKAFEDLQGDKAHIGAGLGVSVAIPNQLVSINLYAKGYLEAVVLPDIDSGDAATIRNPTPAQILAGDITLNSEASVIAAGVTEVGVATARMFNILGQNISVGVTPKLQEITTYRYTVNVETFDADDYDNDKYMNDESHFNLDVGAIWLPMENVRVSFVGKNLISKSVDVFNDVGWNGDYVYKLEPKFTLGAALVSDLFTVTGEMDLNEQSRFTASGNAVNPSDDTQFVRFGAEFNAFGWAQVRAGYKTDTKNTIDDAFTVGLGFSPFNKVHLDLSGSYVDENAFGAAAQLAFTF